MAINSSLQNKEYIMTYVIVGGVVVSTEDAIKMRNDR